MVLGIIPNTPADDLELKIGEIITKVNGIPVKHVSDFYEALQKPRICKIGDHLRTVRSGLISARPMKANIMN